MSKGKEPNDLVKQMSKNLWIYNLQEDGNIGVFLLWDYIREEGNTDIVSRKGDQESVWKLQEIGTSNMLK